MKIHSPISAIGQFFDNSNNDFTAENTQAAIEEAKATAQGLPRWIIICRYNGTVSDGDLIGLDNLLADKKIILPVKVSVKEVSWNNTNTGVGMSLLFYKNNLSNLVYTYTATAADNANGYGFHQLTNPILLDPGEFIYVKYVKTGGSNTSDLGLMIWGVAR